MKNYSVNPSVSTTSYPRRSFSRQQSEVSPPQVPIDNSEYDMVKEDWTPSSAQMQAFVAKEETMAVANIRFLLSSQDVSVRNLKESVIHSADTFDRALSGMLKSGKVREINGKVSLVHTTV